MFAVTRHLRHRGYQADLILSDEFSHFKPEADTFEQVNFNYIKEFDFLKSDILYTDRLLVNRFFTSYDVIIACGYSVAYLTYSKVYVDVVLPYGSDLYDLPFYTPTSQDTDYFKVQRTALAKYQKKGIEEARAVIFDYTNEEFEEIFKKFDLKGVRYKYAYPFIFTPEFSYQQSGALCRKSVGATRMIELRKQFDLVVFNHIRQSWKNPLDIWSYKGNERIFRAFRTFIDDTKASACLVVFEYGTDVEDSKALVKELKLEEQVVWLPVSQRKDILSMISLVDIGIGEIGDHSWFSYGAVYEFLCMKKPVIHHRDDQMYLDKVESLYPMYSANNEATLLAALKLACRDKETTARIAGEAHQWYMSYAIEKPIGILLQVIGAKNRMASNIRKFFRKLSLQMASVIFYIKLKLT